MNSGVVNGNAAMIDGLVQRIAEELGQQPTVVATGGIAKAIVPYCKTEITLNDNLLLEGLAILYYKNAK